MNFSIFKKDTNKNDLIHNILANGEVFEVKDLYVSNLGKVKEYAPDYDEDYSFGLGIEEEIIIVKRIDNKKVLDVLNNTEYFQFYSNKIKLGKLIGFYMVGELKPLSMVLEDKTKTHISKRELLKIFYPEKDIPVTIDIKDVVLKQIKETGNKINKSSLEKERKDFLKNELVEIARNYVDTLKKINNSNSKAIRLDVNHESIINLRKEVMRKLVEIEMELPPEDIDNISNELMLLEQEIVKSK